MPDALNATMTACGPGVGSGNSASSSLRSPRKVTPRILPRRLLRGRLLERIFYRREGFVLDGPWLAIHHLDLADINVLHDVAGRRVDRDRAARTFPLHA